MVRTDERVEDFMFGFMHVSNRNQWSYEREDYARTFYAFYIERALSQFVAKPQ